MEAGVKAEIKEDFHYCPKCETILVYNAGAEDIPEHEYCINCVDFAYHPVSGERIAELV